MFHRRGNSHSSPRSPMILAALLATTTVCGWAGQGAPDATAISGPVKGSRPARGNHVEDPERTGNALEARTVVFRRMAEPREHAFTLLVPHGWSVEGGIVRVDPLRQGGAAQSIEAKVDFSVQKDPAGTVMIRWLPDVWYIDARMTPAGQMGLFPPGSNYNGMTVMPAQPAASFLKQMAFPMVHRGAQDVRIVREGPLPELVASSLRGLAAMAPQLAGQVQYDAAFLRLQYTEGGTRFEEVMVTLIENMGQIAAGMWRNRSTFYLRAPAESYRSWEPVIGIIQGSVRLDPRWVAGELRGQVSRSNTLSRTQAEINRIGEEIARHQATTNHEIQNDMYLTFTEQEEYVNPFNGKVETGTDQWRHRWINRQGDVVYTDSESYDPNTDIRLHLSGFRRSPVRPRRTR